jgi:hypothetical protein
VLLLVITTTEVEGVSDELDKFCVWVCDELCVDWSCCCCNGNEDDEESEVVTVAPSDVEGCGNAIICWSDVVEPVDVDVVSAPEEV